MNTAIIYFDGAAEPSNPGNCACGVVIDLPSGEEIVVGKELGWNTNNYGEYSGLILGAETALDMGIEHIIIKGDSQLVIYQCEGRYSVRSPNLISL